MKAFWDERYASANYAYGEEPNEYVREKLRGLRPGKALFPAEGEGRNAVFAASLGWDVYAFDISEKGKEKAETLAQKMKQHIRYELCSMEDVSYEPMYFDALVLVFAHFAEATRNAWHKKLQSFVKPGGHIILEAFSKSHLAYQAGNENAGGPRDLTMLYNVEMITADFSGTEPVEAIESIVELKEGPYHNGKASVIRFHGIKH